MKRKIFFIVCFVVILSLVIVGVAFVKVKKVIPDALASGEFFAKNRCFKNYQDWPRSSNFKKDVAWSTSFMETPANPVDRRYIHERYRPDEYYVDYKTDYNGDYFPDYLYIHRDEEGNKDMDCLYLSNGEGWEPAYRCVRDRGTYYGDCAMVN